MPLSLPPALRYPAFRAFWLGMLASVSGFQILRFGQFWLIFEMTGSPLALGWVGLANGIPAIFFNLFGGVAADKLDQRRLVYITQTVTAMLIFLLATITLLDLVKVWHLLTIAFLAGGVEAFDQPARRVLFPQLIERKDMMSAVALNSSIWPGTRIMAPAAAGFIIAIADTAACFYLAGLGFLIMAAVTFSLRVPHTVRESGGNPLHYMLEGLDFIRKDSTFTFLIALTFFSSFFGMSYNALLPVFAVEVLRIGAGRLGLLMGVGAIGSLASAIWLASGKGTGSRGLLIFGGAVASGLSIAAFGLTSKFVGSFELAMALMLVMGVSGTLFNTAAQSSLQMMVPRHIMGRVMGFYGMTWNIRPLGGLQASALASISVIGAPIAIAIGGAAVVAFALVSALASSKVRNLGSVLRQAELDTVSRSRSERPSPSTTSD